MAAIERIGRWKQKLLDLSRRNRLLFYKPTKRSTLRLIAPSCQEIFDRLVLGEQPLSFLPVTDDAERNQQEPDQPVLRADLVLADQTGAELAKTLHQLRYKARTAVEEQGVTVLFVAFGLLEWREADASREPLRSPLLLVPVELVQGSILEPFRLVPVDGELVINPTLAHKLEHDFGIALPTIPDEEEWRLEQLLEQIEQLVAQQGWRVAREVNLSLFSFLKLNMYKDLERYGEAMAEHPLVAALAGDGSRLPPVPDDLTGPIDLDRSIRPRESFQVLDADSSQQEAILAAQRGVSFVLQGPPGSGKSQTITNMIAERLAAGKRVLFVSEKMAALEVVHRRLTEAGLGDFCLQLHSHRANKKEVVDELGRTLMADRTQVAAGALEQLDRLELQRAALNDFVGALHLVREPLGRSVYQIHGEVARLETAPDINFSLGGVESRTPADIQRYGLLLEQLANTAGRVGADYLANPWRGATVPAYTLELQHDITTHFKRLDEWLLRLRERLDPIALELGLPMPESLQQMDWMVALLALAGDSPQPPSDWLLADPLEPLRQKAGACQAAQAEWQSLRAGLLRGYAETVLTMETAPCLRALSEGAREALRAFRPEFMGQPQALLDRRPELTEFLQQVMGLAAELLRLGAELAPVLVVPAPGRLAECHWLAGLAEWVANDPRPAPGWFDPLHLRMLTALAREGRERLERLAALEATLAERYEEEVLSQEVAALLQRFRSDYSSLLRILKPGYHREMRLLRSFARGPSRLSYRQALADLRVMKEILELRTWAEQNEGAMSEGFGAWYRGRNTDWTALEAGLQSVAAILEQMRPDGPPQALRDLLVRSGAPVRQVAIQKERLMAALARATDLAGRFAERSPAGYLEELPLRSVGGWAEEALRAVQPVYEAYDQVLAHRREIGPVTVEQVLKELAAVQRLQSMEADLEASHDDLTRSFGRFYQGLATDWPAVFAALDWAGRLRAHFGAGRPSVRFAERLCADPAAARLAREAGPEAGRLVERSRAEATFAADLFEPGQVDLTGLATDAVRQWLRVRLDNLAALEDWVDFRQSRERCAAAGLGPFVETAVEQRIGPNAIKPAFFKRFYRLWLDQIYSRLPELQSFRGRRHEGQIQEFRELDSLQLRVAQSRLRARLSERRPNPHLLAAKGSEVAVLLRETEKRRRLKPLRKLFQEIPTLLLTLKPCLLMSPLSVSQFLEPERYQFDTVLFDEASQICPEDAVGAIFRGSQVIIVGDREQLPPTNFFNASVGEGEFDEEAEEVGAYESILDECSGVLHRKSLTWHYRSRHEHLIAFSNAKFYQNRLVTFPSPVGRLPGQGVEFISVPNGVYDRSGSRTNKVEAQRVAGLVFDHFRIYPQRSLGVVTFSEAQQSAVDAAIRQLRLQQPEMEPFFREDREEPFFVKNLENVQGDERDTVIFSVGYAKDANGVLHMNFGPLSQQGGYRRLNVAITRAKHNVKLVSSLQPTEIDLDRTNAEGVRMLRLYMEFAMHGPEALQRELSVSGVPVFDSPFEEAVYRELIDLGHEVDTQVGCSGYRIDLAVRHPEQKGHYLLGIECDGAAYHSSRTARDRDRLREAVLRGLGWQIHRIWSTDWIKDPRAELKRLVEALDQAKGEPAEPLDPLPVAMELEVAISPAREAESLASLPGTTPYREADIGSLPRRPGQSHADRLGDALAYVVDMEGPVHLDLLVRRLSGLFGRERATPQLKREIQGLVQRFRGWRFAQRGEFLWPLAMERPPVRVPSGQERPRPIGQICTEELAEGIMLLLARGLGMSVDQLIVETARLMGFHRTSEPIRQALHRAVAMLEQAGRIELLESMARLARAGGGA